jgi:hypothetical protein
LFAGFQFGAGKEILRVYDALYSPRGFWAGTPTRPGRFHLFTPGGASGRVPVLYASDRLAGAISEAVFHDVPVRATKHVPRATLRRKLAITLTATRDLRLATSPDTDFAGSAEPAPKSSIPTRAATRTPPAGAVAPAVSAAGTCRALCDNLRP